MKKRTSINKKFYFTSTGRILVQRHDSYASALAASNHLRDGKVVEVRDKSAVLAIRHLSRDHGYIPSVDLVHETGIKWTFD